MADMLDGSASEREDDERPRDADSAASAQATHSRHSFIFSPMDHGAQTLGVLRPDSAQILTIFDIFQQNVDPVAKIFHRHALRATMLDSMSQLRTLDRLGEVILFSIFYAALSTLNPYDCKRYFNEDLKVLLPRCRYAVEQALARARFLDSQNFDMLSALVLFLLCVRRHDSSRFVSSMLGVVIRNAQAMGLHRDGSSFDLSPFQTEMRRRVWWHISVLDLRSSEDHGHDPTILEGSSDTKFPSNLNDEDLSPAIVDAKPPREGSSDMTFCLIRFEVDVAIRKLHYSRPIGAKGERMSSVARRELVKLIESHFYETYVNRCDILQAADWVASSWAKLMLAKMWLAVSNPLQNQTPQDHTASLAARQLSFEKAIEVLELTDLLETSPRAERWQWLFLTHTQWHAVVLILAFLCERPDDAETDRGWQIASKVYERWLPNFYAKTGMLWKPLRRLMARAEHTRQMSQSRRKAAAPQLPVVGPDGSERTTARHGANGAFERDSGYLIQRGATNDSSSAFDHSATTRPTATAHDELPTPNDGASHFQSTSNTPITSGDLGAFDEETSWANLNAFFEELDPHFDMESIPRRWEDTGGYMSNIWDTL